MVKIYSENNSHSDNVPTILSTKKEKITVSQLLNVILKSWTNKRSDPLYTHMNLPPLITKNSEQKITPGFEKWKGFLTLISDNGSILGPFFFSVGSVIGYTIAYGVAPNKCGIVPCQSLQRIMALIGAIFYTVTPIATFLLTNAVSCKNGELTLNSVTYIIGGFCFLFGVICFYPFPIDKSLDQKLTLIAVSLYVLGSLMYVFAVSWDIYRARKLRDKSQISFYAFMIEGWVSGLYLLGSFLALAGSILLYPAISTRHVYALFLLSAFCFTFGSISGFIAQLWRYCKNIIQKQEVMKRKKILTEQIKKCSGDVHTTLGSKKFKLANTISSWCIPRQLPLTRANLLSAKRIKSQPMQIRVTSRVQINTNESGGTEASLVSSAQDKAGSDELV